MESGRFVDRKLYCVVLYGNNKYTSSGMYLMLRVLNCQLWRQNWITCLYFRVLCSAGYTHYVTISSVQSGGNWNTRRINFFITLMRDVTVNFQFLLQDLNCIVNILTVEMYTIIVTSFEACMTIKWSFLRPSTLAVWNKFPTFRRPSVPQYSWNNESWILHSIKITKAVSNNFEVLLWNRND